MVLGGFPVLALSLWKQDPGVSGHLGDLTLEDWVGLFYTSVFGSSIATGLFFYYATRGTYKDINKDCDQRVCDALILQNLSALACSKTLEVKLRWTCKDVISTMLEFLTRSWF